MLVLVQSSSPAQTNAAYETDAPPGTGSATPVPRTSQPLKSYHDGSIRDIGAVGNRDIGCGRGLGGRYSLQAQIDIGRSYAHEVEASSKLITDPAITDYVNRIGQNLASNSDAQVRLTVKVIDIDDVNAFSLPGGFVYVDSGLILAADNEAELAGVISHEIAHVAACHAGQAIAREQLTNVASMPLIFRVALRRITRNTIYLKPTRGFESEADFLGVEYLYKAGYDPQAFSSFFEKVKAIEKQAPRSGAAAFESHQQMSDRIERTRQEIDTLLPPALEYKLDTFEFQEIKQRLSDLESGHKVGKHHGEHGPTATGARTTADAGTVSDDADQSRR